MIFKTILVIFRLFSNVSIFKLRPCERRKFPNFSFLQVSELFGYRSLEFFWKTSKFAKILQKIFGNKFGSKNPVFEAKTRVLGSKTVISEHSKFKEYSEFVLFQIFRKLQKNDVKIEFLFLQKTCSDSNSDSNIRVQVWYAGALLQIL